VALFVAAGLGIPVPTDMDTLTKACMKALVAGALGILGHGKPIDETRNDGAWGSKRWPWSTISSFVFGRRVEYSGTVGSGENDDGHQFIAEAKGNEWRSDAEARSAVLIILA
jgi:hypothetical protein